MQYTLDDSPQIEKKKKSRRALAGLITSSMALSAMMEPYPHVRAIDTTGYCKRGMTGKAWNRKKSRRKLARKARREQR